MVGVFKKKLYRICGDYLIIFSTKYCGLVPLMVLASFTVLFAMASGDSLQRNKYL